MDYDVIIGLEVHAQLLTSSKIFCRCSTEFGAGPNSHTCPICEGLPGVLPVLNRKVVEYATKMALATNCRLAARSRFARKNYFYPDLPKAYQISQYELPLAEGGSVEVDLDHTRRTIGITRIHLEEDAGKLVHPEGGSVSLVDFNRCGVPLIEIVSEPDMRSPEEASAYLKTLRDILVYLEVCDGNMEEGSFRCDANVSLRPRGQEKFGTRAEIKNMNSFRNVQRALEYEIKRQRELLESGGTVVQETRLWDADKGITLSMRSKEEAHDYRYFPEPDLVPLVLDPAWVEDLRRSLPELPMARKAHLVSDYGLPEYDAGVLTASRPLADYFEEAVADCPEDAKALSNWIMSEMLRELKAEADLDKAVLRAKVRPAQLAGLLRLVREGKISGKIAKGVFADMWRTGKDAGTIVGEQGLVQVSDEGAVAAAIEAVLAEHSGEVEAYRAGKTRLFGFFVGETMKKTRGQANPKTVNELLRSMLEGGKKPE
ncbi:MAG: Asp-tRNA(Asn)/Glu-tRNA(Gln) amidotransferase subunit GatB [Pseudomonadota bacterium]